MTLWLWHKVTALVLIIPRFVYQTLFHSYYERYDSAGFSRSLNNPGLQVSRAGRFPAQLSPATTAQTDFNTNKPINMNSTSKSPHLIYIPRPEASMLRVWLKLGLSKPWSPKYLWKRVEQATKTFWRRLTWSRKQWIRRLNSCRR